MNRSPRNTCLKRQSSVPSNLQKKAKASDTHADKRRLVNAPNVTCKGKRNSLNTSKATCKGFRQKGITYEMSADKLNPEGLDFPDNFMAVMGWRRVGLNNETHY